MREKILYKNDILTIELTAIKIEKTYRNLLCGLPTKEMNNSILSSEIEDAKLFCETDDIFLIKPRQTKISINGNYELGVPYRLPDFRYVAKLVCYSSGSLLDLLEIDSEVKSFYFDFGLVWFQDDLSIAFPEKITEYIVKKAEELKSMQ